MEETGSGYVQCRTLIFEVLNLHILEPRCLNCFWCSLYTQYPRYCRTHGFNFYISENVMYVPLRMNTESVELYTKIPCKNKLVGFVRSCDHGLWQILIINPTRCTNFSNLFWNETVHVLDSSSVHHQEFLTVHTAMIYVNKPVWRIPLPCVQWKTPDDGQRNCPKHVQFHSKINLRN